MVILKRELKKSESPVCLFSAVRHEKRFVLIA